MNLFMIYSVFIACTHENKKEDLTYKIHFAYEQDEYYDNTIEFQEDTNEYNLCKVSEFIKACINFNKAKAEEQILPSTIEIPLSQDIFESMAFLLQKNENINNKILSLRLDYLIYGCEYLQICDNSKVKIYTNYFKIKTSNGFDSISSLLQEINYNNTRPMFARNAWIAVIVAYVKSQGMKMYIEKSITKIDYCIVANLVDIDTNILEISKYFSISLRAFNQLSGYKWNIMIQLLNKIEVCSLDLRYCNNLHKEQIECLDGLKSLKRVNLSNNRDFVKQDIDAIFTLENLVELDISCCNIQPSNVENINRLKNLKKLNVCWNQKINKRDIGTISSLQNLTKLDINYCDIQKGDLENISKLKNLRKLNISWNRNISKQDITSTSSLENLSELSIKGCNLQPGDLNDIYGLRKLIKLSACKNRFNKQDIHIISLLKNLTELYINCCNLNPGDIENIVNIKNLNKLNILGNTFNKQDIAKISLLENLTDLDISCCSLQPNDLEDISRLKNLNKLNILGNTFNKQDIAKISLLENLTDLDISCCSLQPDDLEDISRLKNLNKLNILGNVNISKKDIAAVSSLKNLIKLNIKFCNLSQEVVKDIGKKGIIVLY